MFEKLEAVEKRYDELTTQISDPAIIANNNEWRKLIKEHSSMEDVVVKYKEYKQIENNMNEAKEMMEDPEMKELAEEEYYNSKEKLSKIEEELKFLLIPKDPNDDKSVICEIRGGAGGEEASLFAATLFRMYGMYAERKHWKIEILNENSTELGGYKEISFMVTGKGAYSRLKFESGVHRVQRVPDTENSGRIHTSTATVAVLPVVEDVEIDINPADIKMEVFRASGAGGQHINKTSSAVRLIHIPTGIVAECQTQRSQLQNREYAMNMLKSRLYEIEKQKQDSEIANTRKSQVGSGDRSEKIRTYNYPQGRITDHRIGFSIFQMENLSDTLLLFCIYHILLPKFLASALFQTTVSLNPLSILPSLFTPPLIPHFSFYGNLEPHTILFPFVHNGIVLYKIYIHLIYYESASKCHKSPPAYDRRILP